MCLAIILRILSISIISTLPVGAVYACSCGDASSLEVGCVCAAGAGVFAAAF